MASDISKVFPPQQDRSVMDWVDYRSHVERHTKEILKSTLSMWLKRDMEGSVNEIPESLGATVVTNTGLMGGNQSHGAVLSIKFWVEGGANTIDFTPSPIEDCNQYGEGEGAHVTLVARGDWEQQGLTDALAHLLFKILSGECG